MPKKQGGGKYLKLYYVGIEHLNPLPGKSALVFLNIIKPMTTNNIVRLDKDDREKVGKSVGLSERKVMETLTTLVRNEAMLRICKGKYFVNPYIVVKRGEIDAIPLLKKWDRLLTEQLESESEKEFPDDK